MLQATRNFLQAQNRMTATVDKINNENLSDVELEDAMDELDALEYEAELDYYEDEW